MDPNKDIAEERLLRVIEKGQARSSSVSIGANKAGNPFKWIRMWFAQNYARPVGRETDTTLRVLRVLSSVLWLGLAAFGIYFAADLIKNREVPFKQRVFDLLSEHSKMNSSSMNPVLEEKLKPESHYVQAMQNPNPFTGGAEEVIVESEPARGPSAEEKLAGMIKGLTVVGINRGSIPDAIIENSEEKRTFFVKAGDKINDLTVKEIKRDTVILSYEGSDVEIV